MQKDENWQFERKDQKDENRKWMRDERECERERERSLKGRQEWKDEKSGNN